MSPDKEVGPAWCCTTTGIQKKKTEDDDSPTPESTLSLSLQHRSVVLIKRDMSRIVKGHLVPHYNHKNVYTACLVLTLDSTFTSTAYFN